MISFTTDTRTATVTRTDDGSYSIELFAVTHPQRPDLGSKLYRRRASGSRYTAVGIAQDWVGPNAEYVESEQEAQA